MSKHHINITCYAWVENDTVFFQLCGRMKAVTFKLSPYNNYHGSLFDPVLEWLEPRLQQTTPNPPTGEDPMCADFFLTVGVTVMQKLGELENINVSTFGDSTIKFRGMSTPPL